MTEPTQFPLISGYLSLDLVNTELVRRGQRYDLLLAEGDLLDWLYLMKEDHFSLNEQLLAKAGEEIRRVFLSILEFRAVLREQFEAIADGQDIAESFIALLEHQIEQAPYIYKIKDQQLVPVPVGKTEDRLKSLIALDALTLIADNKLHTLRRCSNPDCVLLFMDEMGRRKWCSMKICGNRKKAARFQQRQMEAD